MSRLNLTVELLGGENIEDACRDAIALACKLDLTVWFMFNGVKCLARPGDNPVRLAQVWERELQSNRQFKIAADNNSIEYIRDRRDDRYLGALRDAEKDIERAIVALNRANCMSVRVGAESILSTVQALISQHSKTIAPPRLANIVDCCGRPFCAACELHHDGPCEGNGINGWCYAHSRYHGPKNSAV